jgi:hypothetical protein
MIRWPVLTMLLFVSACANPPAADSCAWVRGIVLSQGDVQAVSTDLARQIVAHNEAVARFCR